MCPTTSLICPVDDNIAILSVSRCMLLEPRGVVLCDVVCGFGARPTVATQLPNGVLVVGDAQGGVWLLRLGVHTAPGVVARLQLPSYAPPSIVALTHLPGWGGFDGAWWHTPWCCRCCAHHALRMSDTPCAYARTAPMRSRVVPYTTHSPRARTGGVLCVSGPGQPGLLCCLPPVPRTPSPDPTPLQPILPARLPPMLDQVGEAAPLVLGTGERQLLVVRSRVGEVCRAVYGATALPLQDAETPLPVRVGMGWDAYCVGVTQ